MNETELTNMLYYVSIPDRCNSDLKQVLEQKYKLIEFQFQIGAIQMTLELYRNNASDMFQFQIGAIQIR